MTAEYSTGELRERLAQFAAAVASSSLYLLRAIEKTVDALQDIERLSVALAASTLRLAERIRASAAVTGQYLDPDDQAIDEIEAGYRALEACLPQLLVAKSSIDEGCGRDGESLHVAYDRTIAAWADLIEAGKGLRAAVISHDLAAEPRSSESFESADTLIAALRSGRK